MTSFQDLPDVPLLAIWGDTVKARRIQGDRITLAIVELAPNAEVPEHRHAAEQLGMVIRGQMHFTVDGETRDLGPGGTWRILGDRPHDVVAGPEGAVVIDVFSPVRARSSSMSSRRSAPTGTRSPSMASARRAGRRADGRVTRPSSAPNREPPIVSQPS
jgi:quercetin dioxygenase-like cupin family protein